MGLESATYISDLVSSNPVSGDPKSQGDDHLRLIKSVLQTTLPNLNGAATASAAELSALHAPSDASGSIVLGTNWTSGGLGGPFSGSPSFLSRLVKVTANLMVFSGVYNAGGSPGATIATLPSGYRPTTSRMLPCYFHDASGPSYRAGLVLLDSTGALTLCTTLGDNTSTPTVASGDRVFIPSCAIDI